MFDVAFLRSSSSFLFLAALAIFICLLPLRAFAKEPVKQVPDTLETLQKRINDLVTNSRYNAALFGVKIVSLDSGKVLYEHDAQKLFEPASNSKLYTMALALDRLGPDHRIKTSLFSAARPDASGTLNGDLVIYGRGDPTICGEYNNWSVLKSLEPLVAALTNAGVKQITGDLVGDDSYFHGDPYGSGWMWDDMENDYGAEISALTINSNVLQLLVKPGAVAGSPARLELSPHTTYITIVNETQTTAAKSKRTLELFRPLSDNTVYVYGHVTMDDKGSSEDVTMHDPAGLFAALFKDVLASHGITVGGRARSVHWREREAEPVDFKKWVELGFVESRPMRDIIRSVQKPSQNLYTDLMLEYVGTRAGLTSGQSSEEAGVRQLNDFLGGKVGIKKGETLFEEGSGLSRNNLTTPNATVKLLTFMSKHKDAAIYYNALPVAGVDGTLHKRMKGTAAAGNVHAKTGTLHWANSLSGYMTNAAGEHLVFSMMLTRFQNYEKDRTKTEDLDAIAEMLAASTVRTGK